MAARFNSPLQARLLGERLRIARQSRKMTLKDLEAKLGVHHSQISRIERGKAITLSKNVQKICKRLGVQPLPELATPDLARRIDALAKVAPMSSAAVDTLLSALEQIAGVPRS